MKSDILTTEHKLIEIEINLRFKIKTKSIKKINYDQTNFKVYLSAFKQHRPTFFDLNRFQPTIDKFNNAIKKANEHLLYKSETISTNLPWYDPDLDEIKININRTTRSLTTSISENKFKRLSDRLNELNAEFKFKLEKAKSKFLNKVHSVSNLPDFWMLWKKTKLKDNDSTPIFKNNQTKSIE